MYYCKIVSTLVKQIGNIAMSKNLNKNSGFTLVELVIVIVLIGILAAVAIPKFTDLTGQARTAAASNIAGAFSSAAGIAHAQWIASGSPGSITLGTTTVYMSTQGWPEGTGAAANGTATAAKCLEVWNGILSNAPEAGTTCSGTCEFLAQVTASPVCQFIDQQGSGSNTIQYNITTGAVNVV